MNNVDKQYLELLRDIIDNGVFKKTRSGNVRSVFGRTMRFNLQEGLPLLTTKKVFVKGIIHELLWFLKGDTNIKYLVDNDVHIWTDDALRWFRSLDLYSLKRRWFSYDEEMKEDYQEEEIFFHGGYILMEMQYLTQNYYIRFPETKERIKILPEIFQKNITKELFEEYTSKQAYIERCDVYEGKERNSRTIYHFGDLGEIYGKQWRKFGKSERDQIQWLIDTLKNNPDDRRMVLTGWNPDVIDKIALPACHMFSQFWTRELNTMERLQWLCEHSNGEYDEWKTITHEKADELNVPKRALSLSFYCRSQDYPLGTPYNIASYAILCYIIANICNMVPEDLVYIGGDIHIYENQINGCLTQLKRKGYSKLPKFKIKHQLNDINNIKFDDFEVLNYKANDPIKYPLSVG